MRRVGGNKRTRMGSGRRREDKNERAKPSSNPKGWPDHSTLEDRENRPHRVIALNDEQEHWFVNNFVRTSKYTLLDFLPRFLMEEFHPRRKMANAYFLVLASLQTIPEITNTFGVPTILLPLSVVVIVDAVFAVLEDVARHRADAKANASPTRALDLQGCTKRFRRVEWSDVRVGDLLLVKNRESIPADLLVMGAHEPSPDARSGICYVETKSLDGETNLKIRQAIRPTIGRVSSAKDAACLKGRVEMEHPNKLIDSFSGSIELEAGGADGRVSSTREPIQTRNLLLRGCVLRNTRWVVGLVLNTGPDTKIIMSSLDPPHKSSRLEQRTNLEVWRIVRLLCLVCLLGAIGSLVWNKTQSSEHVYLEWKKERWSSLVKEAIIQFFYLFLLLGNFIPVSLYVSMGTVKFCQAFFMKQDLDMYHEETDTPATVRTMALNEELGQVSHVFSDKTGTLTQNVMEFRKCSIGGISYGRGVTEIGRAVAAEMGQEISKEDLEAEIAIAESPSTPHVRFYDPRLLRDLEGSGGEEQRRLLSDFFMALAVCHTVIPERGVSKACSRTPSRGGRRCRGGPVDKGFDASGGTSVMDDIDVSVGVSCGGDEMSRRYRYSSGMRTDDGDEEEGRERKLEDGEEEEECPERCWDLDEIERGDGGRGEGGEEEEVEEEEEAHPKLSASSPDDEALVLGARHFGMEFRDRIDNNACVRRSRSFLRDAHGVPSSSRSRSGTVDGGTTSGRGDGDAEDSSSRLGGGDPQYVEERYEVLRILDFSSARKRMSVIVRDPRGRIRVLCKGADSVMIPRLSGTAGSSASLTPSDRDDGAPSYLGRSISPASAGARASASASASVTYTTDTISTKTTPTDADEHGQTCRRAESGSIDLDVPPGDGSAIAHASVVAKFAGGGGLGTPGDGEAVAVARGSETSREDLSEALRKRQDTLEHMEAYAREGLRTLVVTAADLDEDWFVSWDRRFEAASTDLVEVERKKSGLDNAIDSLMDEVETNLELLGCTAIEDKLQDGVGRCVEALQGAGVKVWMLTGDKEETAVNIGVACQLLGPEASVERIIINMDPQTGCEDEEEVRDRLEYELQRISEDQAKHRKGDEYVLYDRPRRRALIIDGQALSMATGPLCRNALADLARRCVAVICCRVSPDQKREVVSLVCETIPTARTLAIGDGANDVAMIQRAHIGIGISGQEGMQAVNASDFAIAQFRFLQKLMLFHGRQNYRRTSKLVVYTFYKNVLMAVPMAWYILVNGYSGQKFYTEGGIQMYNILFTLWPILFLGCFDRDVTPDDTIKFPGLYVLGINDVFFNAKVFWSWMGQAIAEAALITFVPLCLLKGGPDDYGTEQSLFFFGGTTFTLVILLANSKILWLQYRWSMWAAVLVILSVCAWFGAACTITSLIRMDYDFYMVYFHLLANPTFWAVITLCFTAVIMRDLAWKFFHRWWQPKLHHMILETEASGGGSVDISPSEWAAASARGRDASGVAGDAGCRRRDSGGMITGGGSSDSGSGERISDGGDTHDVSMGRSVNRGGVVGDSGGGVGRGRDADVPGPPRFGLTDGSEWSDVSGRPGDRGSVEIMEEAVGRRVGFGSSHRRGSRLQQQQQQQQQQSRGQKTSKRRDAGQDAPGRGFSSGVNADGTMAKKARQQYALSAVLPGDRRDLDATRSSRQHGRHNHERAISEIELEDGRGWGDRGRRSGGLDDDVIVVNRRSTDMMSSRPSSVGGIGDLEGVSGAVDGATPATSYARSWSWTRSSEGIPQIPSALQLTRSRSERTSQRRRRSAHSSAQRRSPEPRPLSGGFAYSTDEASAALEAEMILNHAGSPLRNKQPSWDANRSTLDRIIRRRENGPSGYGSGRWSTQRSSVPIGPKPHRDPSRHNPNLRTANASGVGGSGRALMETASDTETGWRIPGWFGIGSGGSGGKVNDARERSRGGEGFVGGKGDVDDDDQDGDVGSRSSGFHGRSVEDRDDEGGIKGDNGPVDNESGSSPRSMSTMQRRGSHSSSHTRRDSGAGLSAASVLGGVRMLWNRARNTDRDDSHQDRGGVGGAMGNRDIRSGDSTRGQEQDESDLSQWACW